MNWNIIGNWLEEPALIARILAHLGLSTRAPPRAPARLVQLIEAA